MGKRKFEFNDEDAYRWSERHQRGDSFRKIAVNEKVERRLVSKVVKGLDRQKHVDEGAATRREIRAGFLREHLEKLEKAAWELLRLTAYLSLEERCVRPPDEAFSPAKPNIQSAVVDAVTQLLLKPAEGTFFHGSTDSGDQKVRYHLSQVEAEAIVDNLKTHLSDMWKQVDCWEKQEAKYLESWRKLNNHAKSRGIEPRLFAPGVQEGLRLLSVSGEADSPPQRQTKLQTAEEIGLWLFRNPATRKSLEECRASYDALKAAFALLEHMLIPSELRRSLLDRTCRHCPLPQG